MTAIYDYVILNKNISSTRMPKLMIRDLLVFSLVLMPLLSGCAQWQNRSKSEAPRFTYLSHTVQYPGETLAAISAWYTGSGNNWNEILRHNPGLKVNKIALGTVIRVPDHLLVKREPLPKKALGSTQRSEAPRPAQPKSQDVSKEAAQAERPQESPYLPASALDSLSAAPEKAAQAVVEPKAEEAPTTPPAAIDAIENTAIPPLADPITESDLPVQKTLALPEPEVEKPAALEIPTLAATPPAPKAPNPKTKSRDELLDELLQE